jgi:hypothetical protein
MMQIVGRIGPLYMPQGLVEGFASRFRPLLMTQEVKLLQADRGGRIPSWPNRLTCFTADRLVPS